MPALMGAVLGLALLGAGCAPRRFDSDAPGVTATIGAALSLTGSASLFGAAQRNGIALARDEINASHMLGTTRLQVIVADDASDREQAAAVFQTFIENSHVMALIGPTLSDIALGVDPLAQQAGLPVLSVSNAAGGITQIGDFIFRDCLTESQLTPEILKALHSRVELHTAALLYSDTDSTRAGSHGFKTALQDLGVQIGAEEVFSADQTDFSAQLDTIAASHPDALFITAPSFLAASVLVQAREHGLARVQIVGSSAFNADAVLRGAGAAAEGLIVGGGWSAANPRPSNQQFIRAYRARFGVDPDQFAAQAYTGVYLLATALRDATQAGDRVAVRDALERVKGLDTPLGAFEFDDARDATQRPRVHVVRDGRFELLSPP